MYVWRIENEKGVGPYYGCEDRWETKDHTKCKRTPSPGRDYVFKNTPLSFFLEDDYKFGFITIKSLRKWFSLKELKSLFKKEFFVTKHFTLNIIFGQNQCIFIPKYRIQKINNIKDIK